MKKTTLRKIIEGCRPLTIQHISQYKTYATAIIMAAADLTSEIPEGCGTRVPVMIEPEHFHHLEKISCFAELNEDNKVVQTTTKLYLEGNDEDHYTVGEECDCKPGHPERYRDEDSPLYFGEVEFDNDVSDGSKSVAVCYERRVYVIYEGQVVVVVNNTESDEEDLYSHDGLMKLTLKRLKEVAKEEGINIKSLETKSDIADRILFESLSDDY